MARRLSAVELEEKAKIARAREAARKADKLANPKPYKPQAPDDYQTVYYRDPLEAGRFLRIQVKKEALTQLGGVSDAGLLSTVAGTDVVVDINRGSKIAIVRLRWYYGDSSPEVKTTSYGTRWIKKYDNKGSQSHYSLPFSVATGAFTLNTIIANFQTLFNSTDGTKLSVIGVNGYAEIAIGYGNQYAVLATSK